MIHRSRLAIAALGASLGLATPPAHADGVGWVKVYNQSEDFFWSWPTGRTSVSHLGTGQYAVTFFGLGNSLNSNVQVNAWRYFSQSPHYCTSAGWFSSNGTDVVANVNCYGMNGALQDGDFSVFYQTRSVPPASGTVAYLWGNQPTSASYTPAASYSYNASGSSNSVSRNGVGNYFAFLPGYHGNGGNVQVTAYGGVPARCEVVDWYHNLSGIVVSIQCVNAAGNPADEYFSLAFSANATEASQPGTTLGGYAWANDPAFVGTYIPSRPYDWNNISTRKLTVQNIGGGVSFVTMSLLPTTRIGSALGMVTAYGSGGEFCMPTAQGFYGSARHQTLGNTIECYDKTGAALNAAYSATILTAE